MSCQHLQNGIGFFIIIDRMHDDVNSIKASISLPEKLFVFLLVLAAVKGVDQGEAFFLVWSTTQPQPQAGDSTR